MAISDTEIRRLGHTRPELSSLLPDYPMPEVLDPFVNFRTFAVISPEDGLPFQVARLDPIGKADGGYRVTATIPFPEADIDVADEWITAANQRIGKVKNLRQLFQLDNLGAIIEVLLHERERINGVQKLSIGKPSV